MPWQTSELIASREKQKLKLQGFGLHLQVPFFTIRFPKLNSIFDGYEVSYIYRDAVEIPVALQREYDTYLSSAKYISDLKADRNFCLLGKLYSKTNLFCKSGKQ